MGLITKSAFVSHICFVKVDIHCAHLTDKMACTVDVMILWIPSQIRNRTPGISSQEFGSNF